MRLCLIALKRHLDPVFDILRCVTAPQVKDIPRSDHLRTVSPIEPDLDCTGCHADKGRRVSHDDDPPVIASGTRLFGGKLNPVEEQAGGDRIAQMSHRRVIDRGDGQAAEGIGGRAAVFITVIGGEGETRSVKFSDPS